MHKIISDESLHKYYTLSNVKSWNKKIVLKHGSNLNQGEETDGKRSVAQIQHDCQLKEKGKPIQNQHA